MRELHAVYRGMPDRCADCALQDGCDAVHCLPDD